MASEQRFLGELLVAARPRAAPTSSSRSSPSQRERGADLLDLGDQHRASPTRWPSRASSPTRRSSRSSSASTRPTSRRRSPSRLPIAFAKSHKILVVREDEAHVHVVCGDPFDTQALDDLRVIFGKPVEASVGGRDRIEDAINRVYERQAGAEQLESDDESSEDEAASDILDSDEEAPVIRWVNSLFLQAMKERASDIHIEPEEKEVLVRYRIDGELYIARRAPRAFMNSIVSRIKIESALNIAEKRLPQDGRITKKIAGKSFDIRVSTIPTSRGYERIVMRLLNKSSVLLDLPDLGFSPREYALMDGLIRRPDGIILVTGPDRQRQDDDALRVHQPDQPAEPQHPDGRGSGRVRDPGHPPGARPAQDRAHVRQRAPRLPPPGSGHRHGRRDPRPRDARDRDQRVADGPPRALDDPHERRGRRDHAHHRHGRRAVPAAFERHRHPRAAPRARALPELQVPVPGRGLRARGAGAHRRSACAPAPRAATTPRRATSRATSARATCSRRSTSDASAPSSTRPRAARSARTPASRAAAASTSCCSSTTRSGRSSCARPTRRPSSAPRRTWAWTRCATTARARSSPG